MLSNEPISEGAHFNGADDSSLILNFQDYFGWRDMMNMNQIMYDLAYWFDFSLRMARNHPLVSVTAVLVAFLFPLPHALNTMKLISIISVALALVTAILMF